MSKVTETWLSDPASIKGILVEVTASIYDPVNLVWVETPLYLSNIGYLTTDNLISFTPVITGGLQITESISLEGAISMSFGDIGLSNPNGELDNWLESSKYIWTNRAIKVYIGDPSWVCDSILKVRDDFELVFSGLVSDIDASSREQVNLKIRDSLERLNTPLTESKIGTYGVWPGGQTNQDTIKPVVFGEVFNITPLLVDPSTLQYLYNDPKLLSTNATVGTERIIEIRDNGVPIYNINIPNGVNVSIATGTFKLLKTPIGVVTVSLQGVAASINLANSSVTTVYKNTMASIVALICTNYGKVSTRLTTSELDLPNFSAFDSANPTPIGYFASDRVNVLAVCQSILSSIGAQLYITKKGLLQILRVGVPTADAVVTITDNDIIQHSLTVASKLAVSPSNSLGYAKNWTIQTSLLTSIPDAHKATFAAEWLTTTATDNTTNVLYNLTTDPIQKDTCLITNISAFSESTRLTNYYKTARIIYRFTGTARLFTLKLGQAVVLKHNRFNLSTGKSGQVVSLSYNWIAGIVNVEVLI